MAQDLSPEQRSAFEASLARFGLGTDALTHQTARTSELRGFQAAAAGMMAAEAAPAPVVFSSDPEQSHVPPTIVQVNDIAQLKQMAGVPDEHYDAGMYTDRTIDYPEPLPEPTAQLLTSAQNKCDLEYNLTDDHFEDVRRAAQAYMQGQSAKVASYEPMINALMFPTQLAVFSGESLVVDTPVVVSGSAPVSWNYGTITVVEPHGQIIVQTEFNINTQNFIVTTSA